MGDTKEVDTWKSNRIAIKFDQPSIPWPGLPGLCSKVANDDDVGTSTPQKWPESRGRGRGWGRGRRPARLTGSWPKRVPGWAEPFRQSMLQFYTCFACESLWQTNTAKLSTFDLFVPEVENVLKQIFWAFLQNVLGPILLASQPVFLGPHARRRKARKARRLGG